MLTPFIMELALDRAIVPAVACCLIGEETDIIMGLNLKAEVLNTTLSKLHIF